MANHNSNLGKLVSVHVISPAYLQRAVIVTILSFIFFLAMMFAFYVWQNIVYFLLSTAFLIVYIVTMFSWVLMRKNVLKVYENGFSYKNFKAYWHEIKSVELKTNAAKISYEIIKKNGEKVILSEAIDNIKSAIEKIDKEIAQINDAKQE